jgi:ABC-type multidrug transport system fused ATPase/permease subunit
LHERLLGMAIVKAFVQQSAEAETFDELNRDLARRGARRALLAWHFHGWSATGVALAGVLALALAPQEAVAGRISEGGLVAFFTLLGLLLPVLLRMAAANSCFQEDQVSMNRLISILDLDPQKAPRNKAPDLKVTDGEILVQNVSCHLDKKTTLLAETTMRARRGALTAVIGPDGCGKTTLLELLLHFRQPTTGKILIDGQDIAGVSLKSLRSQVGLVAEESPLFDGTIRENIAYGLAADAPRELVERAAQLAGADRFIEKLSKGLDTRVGPGASRLSRSQRRQIALARALAVNPPILLFDEPVSALDPETENAFAQILRTLARNKTVIVASRRLPPSLRPDQNFTLEPIPDGKRRQKKETRNGDAARKPDPGDTSNDDGD